MKPLIMLCLGLMLCLSPAASAGPSTPEWELGDWYNVAHGLAGSVNVVGVVYLDFDLDFGDCQWVVEDLRPDVPDHCGAMQEVYVLRFEQTSLSGHGNARLLFPLPLAGEVDYRYGYASGEVWLRTADLSLVYYSLSGQVTAFLGAYGAWQELGEIVFNDVSLEFCPYLREIQWPVEVGTQWDSAVDVYLSGSVNAEFAEESSDKSGDKSIAFRQQAHLIGGCTWQTQQPPCDAYHIELNDTIGDMWLEADYCPDPYQWHALHRMGGFQFGTVPDWNLVSIDLTEITWQVLDASHRSNPPPEVTVDLALNQAEFEAFDGFYLQLVVTNDGPESFEADTYILLDLDGLFFAWPSWDELELSLDHETLHYGSQQTRLTILDFVWPEGVGELNDIKLWAALFTPTQLGPESLIGNIAMTEFNAN